MPGPNDWQLLKSIYDPQAIYADTFDRGNHHGFALNTLYVQGETAPGVDLAAWGYGVGPTLHGYAASGTIAFPAAMPVAGFIFGLGGRPHTGVAFAEHATAAIHFIARENITPFAQGASMKFLVSPLGTTTTGGGVNRKVVFQLESDGAALGTRLRFTGNGDLAQRLYLQSADPTIPATSLGVLPPANASNAASAVNVFSNVDPANSSLLQLQSTTALTRVASSVTGTGNLLPLILDVGGERLRATPDGQILVNTQAALPSYTANPSRLTIRHDPGVAHALRLEADTTASALVQVLVNGNGAVGSIAVSGNQTLFNQTSDARLKENVSDLDDSASIIDQLHPVRFTWKGSGEASHGLLAQEAAIAYPEAVTEGDDSTPWQVDYSKFVPVLIAEIKSLRSRIASLEAAAA